MQKLIVALWLPAAMAISSFTHMRPAPGPGDPPPTLTLPLSPAGKTPESTLIDSVNYIPLQTSKVCMLKNVRKIYCTDMGYLVWDAGQDAVFLFNKDGGFVRKIEPGKYTAISDMVYEDNQLLLWDYPRRTLYTYSAQLDLLKEEKITPSAATGPCFAPFNNKLLFKAEMGLGAHRHTQLMAVDRASLAPTDSVLEPKRMSQNRNLPTAFNLLAAGDYAYYQPYADTRLFRIDRQFRLDTLFRLDYPVQYQLEHYLAGVDYLPDVTTNAFLRSTNIVAVDGMQHWGSFLYLSYYFRTVRYHLVLNLENNSTHFFVTHPGERLEPDFMESAILGSFSEGLVGLILPEDFVHYRLRTKKELADDANPVIAKFYFKSAALR